MSFKQIPDIPTPSSIPHTDYVDYPLPVPSIKRPANTPLATPNKRTRTLSPFPSSPTNVPYLTHDQQAPILATSSPAANESQSSYVGSSVPTEPYTAQEHARHDRRVEINQSRARQLKAFVLEAAEKLKHENYEWMAKPIIVLIQPMLNYVAMHEDLFDEQIGGLVAVNEMISERVTEIGKDLSEMTTKVTGLEENVEGMKTDMGGIKTDMKGMKTDMKEMNKRMATIETKLDTYMLSMDKKLNDVLLAINTRRTSTG